MQGRTHTSWWAEQLQADLSQGDIVTDLPIFHATNPVKHLKKATYKNSVSGWIESDTPVREFLAEGKQSKAIVISHSCDLDKGKGRIIVAPIALIASVPPEQQQMILEQRHFALMPLPDIPEIGTHFADFRSLSVLHREIVVSNRRIASMTESATVRLHAQIVAFFTRKKLPV